MFDIVDSLSRGCKLESYVVDNNKDFSRENSEPFQWLLRSSESS